MPGVSLGITLPTVGVTVGPQWATDLNTAIQAIIDDVEAKIRPSEINIDADLDMNDFDLLEVGKVELEEKASVDTGAGNANSLQSDGDLHWVDSNGTGIQITSGGSLNLSITGAFTGDYDAVGAEATYSDANKRYTFNDDASARADVYCKNVDASVDVSCVDVNASGSVSATANVSCVDLNASGDVNATGDVTHGERTMLVGPAAGSGVAGSPTITTTGYLQGGSSEEWVHTLPLKEGDRIKEFRVYYRRGGSGTIAMTLRRFAMNGTVGATSLQSLSDGASSGDTEQEVTGVNHTCLADNHYQVHIATGGATARYYGCEIVYDRP